MEVVHLWRSLDPPGRFLTKTDAAQGDDSLWHDVGDKKAREKASQCLRERTPDVMPFVKQLQEQDMKKKEEGKKRKEEDKSLKSGKSKGSSKKSADTIVSASMPDATFSMGSVSNTLMTPSTLATPDVTQSSHSKTLDSTERRVRHVAQTIPTAAALMENVFDDDDDFDGDDDDTLSYATYQKQMQEYLESAKGDGDEYSITDRSILMEAMSTTSREWIRSFQSVGSGNDNGSALMSIGNSLRDVEDNVVMPPPDALQKVAGTSSSIRGQKMVQAAGNASISMLSDLSDFSSMRNKSTRSGKLQNSKAPSNLSMMSELTDLSEGLKDMGLQRGNPS
jgi:hypothetical protein